MLQPHQVEELICIVSAMDRQQLVDKFLDFHGTFPVDFTSEYLMRQPVDQLRHMFVALCLQSGQLPIESVPSAA